jgi:hypothetical protein
MTAAAAGLLLPFLLLLLLQLERNFAQQHGCHQLPY